jgi:hypothetical protein
VTEPRLMTGAKAAAYLGLTPASFTKWVADGRAPKPLPDNTRRAYRPTGLTSPHGARRRSTDYAERIFFKFIDSLWVVALRFGEGADMLKILMAIGLLALSLTPATARPPLSTGTYIRVPSDGITTASMDVGPVICGGRLDCDAVKLVFAVK